MKTTLLSLFLFSFLIGYAQDTTRKEFFMELPYSSGGCIQFSHVEKMQAAGVKSYPLITVVARDNNKLVIDSIGGRWPLSMELFHKVSSDSVIGFYYNWRGLPFPLVEKGDTMLINKPTRRIKRFWISILKRKP